MIQNWIMVIIIQRIFPSFSLARELTKWAANNWLQISVLLQITFCSCLIETTLLCEMVDQFPEQAESDLTYLVDLQKNGDWMIKQLLNSFIAKYCDLPVSRRSIICRSQRLDLRDTDKSQYFAKPCSIIINYCFTAQFWASKMCSSCLPSLCPDVSARYSSFPSQKKYQHWFSLITWFVVSLLNIGRALIYCYIVQFYVGVSLTFSLFH